VKKSLVKSLVESVERMSKSNAELTNSLHLVSLAGQVQKEIIEEIHEQRDLYRTAFHLTAGRLAAHLGISDKDLPTYIENLLVESHEKETFQA